MLGYQGKILHIDLSNRTSRIEEFGEEMGRTFIGGNGFCAKILWDQLKPGTDALSPENVIVFAVGPYTDSAVPSASRACAAAISPLTGLFFDSTFGGAWPITLKRTGLDAVVLHGKADSLVYLMLTEEGVAFKDASHLKGKWIRETCDTITEDEGGTDVLAIGPAGENQVRFAAMAHTWRKSRDGISGRGGMAAVLGSKNVKAIAARGKAKTAWADAKALRTYVNETAEDVRTGTAALHKYGTPILVNMINKMGALGTRNLMSEIFENCEPISGEYMHDNFLDKHTTCLKCPVACGKNYLMKGGEFDGLVWKLPEYETIFALGTMLGIGDPGVMLQANMLCDELGLDTISAGVTLSLAFESMEKGLLSEAEVGEPLKWGDSATMLRLLEDMTHREGVRRQAGRGRQAPGRGNRRRRAQSALRLARARASGAQREGAQGHVHRLRHGHAGRQPPRHPPHPAIRLGPRQHLDRGQARVRRAHAELHRAGRFHHPVPLHGRARLRGDDQREVRGDAEPRDRVGHDGG